MFDDLGVAFGSRIRLLREATGATQDQLARALARTGPRVRWTRARVGQVEAGDANLDVATAYAVALALHELSGKPVRLADLLPESGTGEGTVLLREALAGKPVRGPVIQNLPDPRLAPGWGPVEDAVAAKMPGCEPLIIPAARKLYDGRTGTQERDLRAGASSSPQRRGALGRGVVKDLLVAVKRELADSAAHDAALEAGTGG